jgi:ADP-ribosyl-[dinitrogen reductase] hydrolase
LVAFSSNVRRERPDSVTGVELTSAQVDRAVGMILASAAGDALGVPYEFGSAAYPGWPAMVGGGLGGFEPGEWSDDTAQAFAVLEVAATGADVRTTEALDAIAGGLAEWYAGGPADVGVQTSAVLRRAGRHATAAQMATAAREVHERTGRSAGNGSLMRTAPVTLAHLDDPDALVRAAMGVSALTHHDPTAGEACAVWCLMLRHAILDGDWPELDSWGGVETVARATSSTTDGGVGTPSSTTDGGVGATSSTTDGRDWSATLREAEQQEPSAFARNAWVVGAMQAAWSAITHTGVPEQEPERHLQLALACAIGIGHDTDTVGAIAGAMLGARWGARAVPDAWVKKLHGWRNQTGAGLAELARRAVVPRRA